MRRKLRPPDDAVLQIDQDERRGFCIDSEISHKLSIYEEVLMFSIPII
jgi:hypothetical protein